MRLDRTEEKQMQKPTDQDPARLRDAAKSPAPTALNDPVEEASEESFPASDPPAWNAGHHEAPPLQRGKSA